MKKILALLFFIPVVSFSAPTVIGTPHRTVMENLQMSPNACLIFPDASTQCTAGGGGGGGSPGSPVKSVQFNSAGTFGGSSLFTWDNIAKQLGIGPGASASTPVMMLTNGTGGVASETLYIDGQSLTAGTAPRLRFTQNNGVNTLGFIEAFSGSGFGANKLRFYESPNGTFGQESEVIEIGQGNINGQIRMGVGTDSPAAMLHVTSPWTGTGFSANHDPVLRLDYGFTTGNDGDALDIYNRAGSLMVKTDFNGNFFANGTANFGSTINTPLAFSSVVKTDGSGALTTGLVDLTSQVTGILPSGNISGIYSGITGLGTQAQALNMGSHLINNVTDPASAQDAATKNYVDALSNGLDFKPAALVATIAALPANLYNNGSSGVGATLTGVSVGALTIDSYAVQVGDRVLIKDEVSQLKNGLYSVTAAGSGIAVYVLTRSTDFNQSSEINAGDAVFITSGTVNTATGWVMTTNGTITVGTTAIVWVQFTGLGDVVAGTGLSKSGNTLSLITPVSVANGGTGTSTPSLVAGTNVSISGSWPNQTVNSSQPFYGTVQDEGVSLAQEPKTNFIGTGVACVDNPGSSRTDCTISSGSGSPGGGNYNIQISSAGGFAGVADMNVYSTSWSVTNHTTNLSTTTIDSGLTETNISTKTVNTGADLDFTGGTLSGNNSQGNNGDAFLSGGQGVSPSWGGVWQVLGSSSIAGSAKATTGAVTIAAKDMLMIVVDITGYGGGGDIASLRFNADSTAGNYQASHITLSNATTPVLARVNFTTGGNIQLGPTAITAGRSVVLFCSNFSTARKVCKMMEQEEATAQATIVQMDESYGEWFNTAAQITSVEMRTNAGGTMNVGSKFIVFGRNSQ